MVTIFIATFMILSIAAAFSPKFAGKIAGKIAFFVVFCADFQPAFAKSLDQGQEIFSKSCSVCHSGGQSVFTDGTKTLSLKDLKRNNFGTVESIVKLMKSGKGLMPAFKNSEEELQAVAEFVLDAAVGDKW
jgi:mono/diheme cytochrome c family protein